MKRTSDPRHLKRIQKIQALFAGSFNNLDKNQIKEIEDIYKHQKAIDNLITESAPQFPIDKIAKIDVAILRLAVFEMALDKKIPFKVVIDEAVELAKEFGSETSSGFINGVLGTIHKKIGKGEIKNE